MSTILLSNSVLLILMVIAAVFINYLRDLFTTVIITGVFSLLSACVFLNMHAVDVSFTEAAVGAGIATLLFLATLSKTGSEEKSGQSSNFCQGSNLSRGSNLFSLIIVCLTGGLLIYGVHDIFPFGEINAPVHEYLAPRYIEESPQEIGVPNMVTSVLASYRGFDTLGEVTVIFTAGISVLLLLGKNEEKS